MRLPTDAMKKAVAKRKRATGDAEGSGKRIRSWTPIPPSSEPQSSHGAAPPINLIAESPPEEPRVEVIPSPVEPATSGVCSVAESALDGGPPAGEQAGEECPTAAGPSAEEMSSTSGTMPTTSESTRFAEGGGIRAVPSRPSIMNHGRMVEQLMAQVCLPEFQGELRRQGASTFFRDAFAALLWMINSMASTRDITIQGDTVLRCTRQEAVDARARAERALETARAEWAEELEKAKRQAATELKRACTAEARQRKTEAELTSHQLQLHTVTL